MLEPCLLFVCIIMIMIIIIMICIIIIIITVVMIVIIIIICIIIIIGSREPCLLQPCFHVASFIFHFDSWCFMFYCSLEPCLLQPCFHMAGRPEENQMYNDRGRRG